MVSNTHRQVYETLEPVPHHREGFLASFPLGDGTLERSGLYDMAAKLCSHILICSDMLGAVLFWPTNIRSWDW